MNVVFEEQGPIVRPYTPTPRGVVAWMLRNHIAKSASNAQTMLLVVVLIVVTVAVLIGTSSVSENIVDPHKNFVPAVVR